MSYAVVLNGEIPDKITDDFIVCCDGGYDRLKAIDIEPNILLGDMDSIQNVPCRDIIYYPPEKDATDGELATDYCIEKGATKINFYGIFGGRPDHVEGNYSLMYKAFKQGIEVAGFSKDYAVYMVDKPLTLKNVKNKTISIVPFLDMVHINSLKGLKYKADNLQIAKSSSRGVSNEAEQNEVTIDISSGVALVFVINSWR